jgi:hypothetical protein
MKRVKSLTGFNLGSALANEGQMQELHSDLALIADVVYGLCQPEAEKRGVSDEEFGESLVGDAYIAMLDALRESITDFFPKEDRRKIQAAVQATKNKNAPNE